MTGGSECAVGDKDGVPTRTAQVPVGWQRKVEDGAVAYISPSGTILSSVEEVRTYLLTDSTCKCGLECPLVVHKVFNFDPVAVMRPQSQQPGKAEEDMTKLCNHRRKVVAMAALCRSMQASQLPVHGPGSSFCSMEGRDQRGAPLGVRMEDGGHCTYPAQPRHSAQSKSHSNPAPGRGVNSSFPLSPSMTLLHNGSLPHSNSHLSSEATIVSKRPSSSSPGCNSAGYGMPPWYPRPSTPQTIIQRLPQASGLPGSSKPVTHLGGVLPLDVSISVSSSPSTSTLSLSSGGRPGQSQQQQQQQQQQGSSIKSPSPISLCLSPSRTLDATSPHQRSRHSSASSTLSEQGGGGGHPGGIKPPCPARSPLPPNATPCLSPKVPLHPPSPRGRLEGMLQHYKDCSTGGGSSSPGTSAPPQHPSNQSNFQVPQNLTPFVAGGDRKNGPAAAAALVPGPGAPHGSAGAAGGGFLGLPLGQLLSQQKNPQHVSSFPASSLLSAAAKAQMASQKSQALGGGAVDGAGVSVGGIAPSAGPEKDSQQSKGAVSSPSAGSTSVSCTPLLPSAVPEEINSLVPLTEQDKSNGQNPPLLPPLLPPGMMGDLTALGNISSLHSLLGAGPLLLPQVPTSALGVPLPQGQGALNPLACLINSLQLSVGPALTVDKQLDLAEATNPPQEEDIPVSQLAQEPVSNPGHVQGAQPPQQESTTTAAAAASGALFDPYGSFMDTIYTSFLQVSGKDSEAPGGGGGGGGSSSSSSSSNPLSFPAPDLPSLLAQPSAPPSLSPRRACSVHNPDLSRLGMEAAQSPARGTPKLSEDASSTPPPSKPAGGSEGHDEGAPLPPAFLEEAKTDGSSSLCVYSNGLASGPGLAHQGEQVEEGVRPQPQGYLSTLGNAEAVEDVVGSNEVDMGKEPSVRTGGRRGRKRKQVLERVPDGPGGLDSIIEEPQVTTALPKPVRSTRGKRRRVVR